MTELYRTAMGWINPVKTNAWRVLLEREISSFVAPFANIDNYTTSRTVWYDRFLKPSNLRSWLLAMEEHTFYVYLLASLVTKIMSRKDILPPDDREIVFAGFTVYSSDLKEESPFCNFLPVWRFACLCRCKHGPCAFCLGLACSFASQVFLHQGS